MEDSYEGARGDPLGLSGNDALAGTLVGTDVGDQVDAVFAFAGAAGVVAGVDGVGLAAVEGDERVELPAVGERLEVGAAGDVVGEIAGEVVAGVVVHAAVVAFDAEGVGNVGVAVLGEEVEAVGPGVGELAGHADASWSCAAWSEASCSWSCRCWRPG